MPRKPTGTLLWYRSGWHARYWAVVDGERRRAFVDLETKNELTAKAKLAALVAGGPAPEDIACETFQEAAERIHRQRARTLSSARGEASYMRRHVFPAIGRIPVDEVTKADVLSVLDAVRDGGLSTQTIVHVRNAIAAVFKQLRREGAIDALPVPETSELPEALPEAIDDRPKSILSDEELLIYLRYSDPREAESYRGAVRERQMMALLSRCVGGLRTSELMGLTWARARAEGRVFDALEVIRYKTRRKASKKGSKAASRQLYPLGDTVLPLFLRYWYVRRERNEERAPAGADLLFPVRRARRAAPTERGDAIDRVGERRMASTWAAALRRDVQRAFEAAREGKVPGVARDAAPAPGSQRWTELFEGTDDHRPLWFHNSRNAAAVMAEKFQRLNAAARFTGHASGSMLQHYREMAGEIDVVPVVPQLLPDADALREVLIAWLLAEDMPPALVFGPPDGASNGGDERSHRKVTRSNSSEIGAQFSDPRARKNAEDLRENAGIPELRKRLLYPAELRERGGRKLRQGPRKFKSAAWRLDVYHDHEMAGRLVLVVEDGVGAEARELAYALQEVDLDQKSGADDLCALPARELEASLGCAAGGDHVVDDQHAAAAGECVAVHLERVGPVFQRVLGAIARAWQLAGLAHRDERGPQRERERRREHEAARLDAEHRVHAELRERRAQ
jgi:site-specific recombinase XerD